MNENIRAARNTEGEEPVTNEKNHKPATMNNSRIAFDFFVKGKTENSQKSIE